MRICSGIVALGWAVFMGLPAAEADMATDKLYATGFIGVQTGGELRAGDDGTGTFIDTDLGIAGGGSFGYGWGDLGLLPGTTRTEGEISVRRGELDATLEDGSDADFTNLTFFANVWQDFPISRDVIPYAGLGLGVGRVSIDDESDSGFAWQVGGGVNVRATEAMFVGFNYRFISTNFDSDGLDGELDAHQLTGSLTIPFR